MTIQGSHKAAVSAIQARAALYEKNWDNAITYATEAINAAPLASRTIFRKYGKIKQIMKYCGN